MIFPIEKRIIGGILLEKDKTPTHKFIYTPKVFNPEEILVFQGETKVSSW